MKRPLLYLLLALVLILVTSSALAGVEVFSLPWWSVDGGGGTSSGGAYTLHGSAGQPDAGRMQGGSFSLAGGFWGGGTAPQPNQENVFLPMVIR